MEHTEDQDGDRLLSSGAALFDGWIPSDAALFHEVLEGLLDWLNKYRWDETKKSRVRTAVEEAIVNAITHGNGNDRSRFVRVAYRVSERLVEVAVEDQGKGFSPDSIPDPTASDRLHVPGGRGLRLMREFMSQVVFKCAGRRVVMRLERGHNEIDQR